MAYQRCYFPMKVLTLSQGYGASSSTHKYSYAMDFCGKDAGKDEVYAPFDCKVTKVFAKKGKSYEVWLCSTKKVLCANGHYGIMTMSITHPSEIKNMKVGQKFSQGDFICHEGKEGATANHIHLELSTGNSSGWDTKKVNGVTYYFNKNKVKPDEYLFVREDTEIKKTKYKNTTYKFKKESDITKIIYNVKNPPLNMHSKPNIKKSSIIKGAGLKNGDDVIYFGIEEGMNKVYRCSHLGYIAKGHIK